MNKDLDRFRDLKFEDFGRMAGDSTLKPHEKIGFPAAFREGYDQMILDDLKKKLPGLLKTGNTVIDLGSGCGELTTLLIEHTKAFHQKLILIDSPEVLGQIKDEDHVRKAPGKFPENLNEITKSEKADVLVCYSVFHYVFEDGHFLEFIEKALSLLRSGGMFLLGDIPNVSKRNRFLRTPLGIEFHQKLMNTAEPPSIAHFEVEEGKIDDGIISGIMSRYRNFGVETYLLPQPIELPLSNSREDILFVKH